ncbi:hypothetical protein T484DRAFT_1649339, partial [Baffinella frigidus]
PHPSTRSARSRPPPRPSPWRRPLVHPQPLTPQPLNPSTPQPLNPQPSTLNPQPSTLNPQQPSTL